VKNVILSELSKQDYKNYTKVVGLKEGNPLFSSLTAQKLDKPISLFRGNYFPRFNGSSDAADYFDGLILQSDKVVLLDDCTFRGTTLMQAHEKINAIGAQVVGVFLLFDTSDRTASNYFASRGISYNSLLTIDQAELDKLKH
jgi:orotate phosphoribosyltransferase